MTKINHISDNIYEIRIADPEIISQMYRDNDDIILSLDEWRGEVRAIVDLGSDDLLRYIH